MMSTLVTAPERVDPDELVADRRAMDGGERTWLHDLARFDASGEWALDGMASCAAWLAYRASMGRSTAHDRVRIARRLQERPIVDEAFGEGSISYSAVRAITRVTDLDADTDQALVQLAQSATIADLERVVRHIELLQDQERPPVEAQRGLRFRRIDGGLGRLELTVDAVELDELATAIEAQLALRHRDQSPSSGEDADRDEPPADGQGASGEDADPESPHAEGQGPAASGEDTDPPRWGPVARADALMDLVRSASDGPGGAGAGGADRYLTHLVIRPDRTATLADGTPISEATAGMIACDTSLVAHLIGPDGELLAMGRKTRTWTTPQRRAALVRDQGTCRWPGCTNTIVDLHHQHWWDMGGPTDLANGFLACRRHHRLLHHQKYRACGDPNATLHFYRPDGSPIGTSTAATQDLRLGFSA